MATPNLELLNRFVHHPPKYEDTAKKHEEIRALLSAVANDFDQMLPESREKAITMTKLEEAMFWANAAVARNQ